MPAIFEPEASQCDRSKCRDVNHDCSANMAEGEPAACADGYEPSVQPTRWAPNNFKCCAPTPEPEALASAIEECIHQTANIVAATVPVWADHCESVTAKTAFQRRQLDNTVDGLYRKHGYQAALWCAMYASAWPMGWTDGNWYEWYLCPTERDCSGNDKLGAVNEAIGTPGAIFEGEKGPMYTMSCAMCHRLRQAFGVAPYNVPDAVPSKWLPVIPGHPTTRYQRMSKYYEEKLGSVGYWDRWPGWDLHPFGVWLADAAWPAQLQRATLWATMERFARYRVTNGEIMHGFMWRSVALLGERDTTRDVAAFIHDACDPTWRWQSEGTNRGTCAHGAGHGLFYYFWKDDCNVHCAITLALPICSQGPLREWSAEGNWKHLCEGGVFHSAFNSLTVEDLLPLALKYPDKGLVEVFCAQGWEACADNLGAEEGAGRFELIKGGFCDASVWTSSATQDASHESPSPPPPPSPSSLSLPSPSRTSPPPTPHRLPLTPPPRPPPSSRLTPSVFPLHMDSPKNLTLPSRPPPRAALPLARALPPSPYQPSFSPSSSLPPLFNPSDAKSGAELMGFDSSVAWVPDVIIAAPEHTVTSSTIQSITDRDRNAMLVAALGLTSSTSDGDQRSSMPMSFAQQGQQHRDAWFEPGSSPVSTLTSLESLFAQFGPELTLVFVIGMIFIIAGCACGITLRLLCSSGARLSPHPRITGTRPAVRIVRRGVGVGRRAHYSKTARDDTDDVMIERFHDDGTLVERP